MPFSKSAFEYSTPSSLPSSSSTAALQWPQLMSGTLNVASFMVSPLLNSQEPLDGLGQLLYLLVRVLAALDRLTHAVLDVVFQEHQRDFFGGRDYARKLGED